ncbi:AAA domain-containing protein [Paenibacillus sp. LMG 31458]|uniref:AAA domain-containing protein n=1 Tax=Paenibacillus phytorum TaxID=2654977 RepID=A0ABX1YB63_9BACL|nr:MoxR family ATPase [Paenibacillus phytorum]NOU77165.1 AAA domain-containing protein [Paenibacillus phytorum]
MQSKTRIFDQPQPLVERMIMNVEKVIVGKRETIEKAFVAMLSGGHLLLEDVPGVGKTMLVRALARTIGCEFKRIQCTPDLLPSDVTGVSVFNVKTNDFEFRPGPLMTPIVLADEVNRTSPKTQSAFLEAMEEKRVTIDGVSYELPKPFVLLATQNPVDYEGTYALPEAQMDRFMMKLSLGYPTPEQEILMLDRLQDRQPLDHLKPVIVQDEFVQLQREATMIHVDNTLKDFIVRLALATREHADLYLGASPRASYALMRAAQTSAYMKGRSFVVPDDIKDLVLPIWTHRLILTSEARMTGKSADTILTGLLASLQTPVLRYVSAK